MTRRPWWHVRKRDLLGLVALVCMLMAVWIREAGSSPDRIVVIGSWHDSQLWLSLALVGTLVCAMWLVSRAWMGGGPRRPSSTFLAAIVTVGAGAACFVVGFATLLGVVVTSNSTAKKFSVPGSSEEYVVLQYSNEDSTSYMVYRGGPWKYTMLGPLDERFSVDYSQTPPILSYPVRGGQEHAAVPVR